MIISASRRSDIPAFYSEWFMNRIREGYVCVQNPFTPRRWTELDLRPRHIDAVVFWTKNPGPLFPYLDELEERGYKYYFQYTLTGYPPVMEPAVPALEKNIATFRALSEKVGPERVVWRFDPVLVSSVTTEAFILGTFQKIACLLEKHTRRVVTSFTHFYKKTLNNLNEVGRKNGIEFADVSSDIKRMERIAKRLSEIALAHSLRVYSCAGTHDLSDCGMERSKCIDEGLIREAFGISLNAGKDASQRRECLCVESRDIGQYNTCLHGCVYCYANSSSELARRNMACHDPASPFLIEPKGSDSFRSGIISYAAPQGNH